MLKFFAGAIPIYLSTTIQISSAFEGTGKLLDTGAIDQLDSAGISRSYKSTGRESNPSAKTARETDMQRFQNRLQQIVTVELGLNYRGRSLGNLVARTTLSKVVEVEPLKLDILLRPYVEPAVLLKLSELGNDFVSVLALQNIGIVVSLDPATLSLIVEAPAKDRGPLRLNLGGRNHPQNATTVEPARIAAGLTTTLAINENFDKPGNPASSVAMSGFLNIGGVRGLNLDYGGNVIIDNGEGESRYDEGRTVLFVDRPERALRYEAGTLFTDLSRLSGNSDFLGVGISKSYSDLQPTRVLRPLGQRSFQLEQPGEVTVLVNGQEVSRFEATAGPVNLDDIPLSDVSNDVSIIVEDQFGRRVSENFSVASDIFLLETGLTEYSVSLGKPRDPLGRGFRYTDDVVGAANIQHGFSSTFTQGIYAFASEDLYVLGSESALSLLNGVAQIELSYSDSKNIGSGAAASLEYRWSNTLAATQGQSFAISVDYRDRAYNSVGSQSGSDTKFDTSLVFEKQFTDTFRLSASGSYRESHSRSGSSESLSVGSTYQLGQFFLSAGARYSSSAGRNDDFGVFASLTRRLGDRQSFSARYDGLSNQASVGLRRSARDEIGGFGYDADFRRRDGDLSLRSSASYTANRYRARLGLRRGSDVSQLDGDTSLTARLQTGFAFADGKFGIGRDPGRGFTMIGKHPSLSSAEVGITARGNKAFVARSGYLGPAVDRVNSPFVPQVIRTDIDNAPFGYDVGEGDYFAVPGARSGYTITVGDDAYRSRVVTFMAKGEALSLATGTLTNLVNGELQVVFTNRAGRALLSNLEPSQYELKFSQSDYSYTFTLEQSSEVYSDLGEINLTEGASP